MYYALQREKTRRRKAGLMTFTLVAVETDMSPVGSMRKMADAGELPPLGAGKRRYVRRGALERWKAIESRVMPEFHSESSESTA